MINAESDTRPNSLDPEQRLWVVSEVYYPELTSTGYYVTTIAEGLTRHFRVKALTAKPNYFAREAKVPRHERHNDVDIFRAASTRLNKNVLTFRLINMLSLAVSMFTFGLTQFKRGDRILVVTNPPTTPFVVALASLIKGASFTLLIHDSYPETLIAVGKAKPDSAIVRWMHYLNRWLYKNAQKIIVVGRDMKELVEMKSNGLAVPVTFIPNWAEVDDVQPRPRNENPLLSELGLIDKVVVLHAGNIGYPTDVETIIECMKLLSSDERFHFVFVGTGVKRPRLETAKRELALTNLTLLEPRPRSDQIEFLNACDIGLVSLVSGMRGVAVPSKTYNIMAAGKPVLALTDEGSEVARIIDEEGIGWHLAPGNAEQLTARLIKILEQFSDLQLIGSKARQVAELKYSPRAAVAKYAQELRG